MKKGDRITVHMHDRNNKEFKTKNTGKIFTVEENNGQLGIFWYEKQFSPFEVFAPAVHFHNLDTGKWYHFNTIKNAIVEIQK